MAPLNLFIIVFVTLRAEYYLIFNCKKNYVEYKFFKIFQFQRNLNYSELFVYNFLFNILKNVIYIEIHLKLHFSYFMLKNIFQI